MGAMSSGGGKANRRAKDAAMAADLKKRGVVRNSNRCPVCTKVVTVNGFEAHIATHG